MSARTECSLVLASASPRRRRLIEWLGVPFSVAAVDTPEDLDSPLSARPSELAEYLAAEKARAARQASDVPDAQLIAAFDTVVVLDEAVLGKPRDLPHAWRMLRALSGRTHTVITGVALLGPQAVDPHTVSVSTNVRMKSLSDCQIEAWMASGEFMGCAGAYNIEAQVADVDVDECYQNVAGLPLCHLARELTHIANRCWASPMSPVAPCDAALNRRCVLGPRILAGGTVSASLARD